MAIITDLPHPRQQVDLTDWPAGILNLWAENFIIAAGNYEGEAMRVQPLYGVVPYDMVNNTAQFGGYYWNY